MFAQAENYCKTIGGGLVSLHSLDSMEMISTQFHAGTMHPQRNQPQLSCMALYCPEAWLETSSDRYQS